MQKDTNEQDPRDKVLVRIDEGVEYTDAIEDIITKKIPSFKTKEFSESKVKEENNFKRHYTQRIDILHKGAQLLFKVCDEESTEIEEIANRYKNQLSDKRDTCQTALAQFTIELIDTIQSKLKVGESEAIKMLDRAECYATVEQGTPSLVTVSYIENMIVIQIEETIPSLEGDLLTEYWDIKQGNHPEWYKQLSDTETNLLNHLLDQADNEMALQRLFMTLPSKLRSIPIPANFRRHHFITLNKNDMTVSMHSQRLRSSNISSIDVKGASDEIRLKHAMSTMGAILAQKKGADLALFQTLTSPIKAVTLLNILIKLYS